MAQTTDDRLDRMETKLSGVQTDVSKLQTDVSKLQSDVSHLQADVAEIKELLKVMYPLLVASNARSEEQSKRIDDLSRTLASLIPSKTAAVG